MRFCTRCGNELKSGERFCTKCGNAVGGAAQMPAQKKSHLSRNILIICIAVILCCGGVLAFNAVSGGMLMGDGRVILKSLKAFQNADGMTFDFSWNCDMDGTEDGETENVCLGLGMQGEVSKKDNTGHFKVDVEADEELEKIELYYQADSDKMDFFVNIEDEWGKGTVDLYDFKNGLSSLKSDADMKEYMKNISVEKTEVGGEKAYAIILDMDVESGIKSIIDNSALAEQLKGIFGKTLWENLEGVYRGLPKCQLKLYVSRKNYEPISAEWDMRSCVEAFVQNMADAYNEEWDEYMSIDVSECRAVVKFGGFDGVSVTIPNEAYKGMDLGKLN